MNYRLARISDSNSLAEIHFECGKYQPGGFMHKLGLKFLKSYYKIHVKEETSIILVAEDDNNFICGFVSGTLAAEHYLKSLRKNRLKLILAVLPVIFIYPGLFRQLKERYHYILLKGKYEEYGITRGPRMDYWAWNPESKSQSSIFLLKAWLDYLFSSTRINSVRGEVDLDNKNILTIYVTIGARIMKEVKLKDGRTRYFIEFENKNPDNLGYSIREMELKDLDPVVEIHIKAFKGFFLTMLGRGFLKRLYKNFVYDNHSVCLVAEVDKEIKGFVIGNLQPNVLFRKMLIRQGYLFILHATKAMLKNPSLVAGRLLNAVSYRGNPPEGYCKPALLSSIGVDPDGSAKGIGSHLIRAFCWEVFLKGSDVVYLTTDKFKNDQVNEFYVKNGFVLKDELTYSNGRIMNRYIKLPDETIL